MFEDPFAVSLDGLAHDDGRRRLGKEARQAVSTVFEWPSP